MTMGIFELVICVVKMRLLLGQLKLSFLFKLNPEYQWIVVRMKISLHFYNVKAMIIIGIHTDTSPPSALHVRCGQNASSLSLIANWSEPASPPSLAAQCPIRYLLSLVRSDSTNLILKQLLEQGYSEMLLIVYQIICCWKFYHKIYRVLQ